MPLAWLFAVPGRPPRLMTDPPLHSGGCVEAADSNCLPGVVYAVGAARSQVDDAAAAPLGGVTVDAAGTVSHQLSGIVDAVGEVICLTWEASQVDDAAATPLGRVHAAADKARSHHLPGVVDAVGKAFCVARQIL